jgi:hypothetical protein
MDYKNYTEFHTLEYKGKRFIYQPYMFGQGAWAYLTDSGKVGKSADLSLQYELNQAIFGDKKTPSLYERFMRASPKEREKMKAEAMTWLTLKVKSLKSNSEIPKSIFPKKQTFVAGGLYFYKYDAKTKETLPFWDRFPLTIILKMESNGFLGLNLHYLPVPDRISFLEKLMVGAYKKYNQNTDELYLAISYEILKDSKRLQEFRPCLKRYLFSHVESKFLQIESHEWGYAANLNVANWAGNKGNV